MDISPRTASHPAGLQLIFYPEPHEYVLGQEKLASVTTLINRWFPQFDAEATARRKAERDGGDHEKLIAEWAFKRDEAAKFGSKVHWLAHLMLQNQDEAAERLAETAREKVYVEAIREALRRISLGYEVVESEKIVFSPDRKVAGTIDLLLRSKVTGEYIIADWKTNREIKVSAYQNEMGTGPCAGLENCNFIHYSLQASCYGALLTSEGYVPAAESIRGVLLHLVERNGRVVCEYVKTRDLFPQAQLVLNQLS